MTWLIENPWPAWLGLTLILAAIEAATVDLTFAMLAGGALAGGLAAVFGAPFAAQVVVAVVVAIALVVLVRPLARKRFLRGIENPGIGAAGLIGAHGWALEQVTDLSGRVKLRGETWTARVPRDSPAIAAGEPVRVLQLMGATAIVAPAPEAAREGTT